MLVGHWAVYVNRRVDIDAFVDLEDRTRLGRIVDRIPNLSDRPIRRHFGHAPKEAGGGDYVDELARPDLLDISGDRAPEDHLPQSAELLVDYPAGMFLWRVRATDDPGRFRDPLELAPPRADERRGPQRMSVDGVNWFYGASTADLAVAEKFRPTDLRFLALGRFETTTPMTLLDLSDEALQLPSIFDLGRQTGRFAALCLPSRSMTPSAIATGRHSS